MTSSYRADIDGLRAVAVGGVVLYHGSVSGLQGGFTGVDVFFVISGYLITGVLMQSSEAPGPGLLQFYARRARRLFPALIAVLTVSLLLGSFLIGDAEDAARLGFSAAATAAFISNIYLWRATGDYFDGAADRLPLLHTWSLSVEEQFYLAFPLLLLFVLRFGRRRAALCLAGTGVMSYVLGEFLLASETQPLGIHTGAAFYLAPARAWELLLGATLYAASPPVPERRWIRNGAAILALLLIVAGFVTTSRYGRFPSHNALLPCLASALLIWVGREPNVVKSLLSARLPVFVGKISYSIYLWHWPLLVYWTYRSDAPADLESLLLWLALSLALAVVSWRWIEEPFRERSASSRLTAPPRRTLTVAGCALASVVSLGVAISVTQAKSEGRYDALVRGGAAANAPGRSLSWKLCDSRTDVADVLKHCSLGDPSDPLGFVAWGDSHAFALAPAFERLAASKRMRGVVVFHQGCPPTPGAYREGIQSCGPSTAARAYEIIKALHPPSVILVATWFGYSMQYDEGKMRASRPGPDGEYEAVAIGPDGISLQRSMQRTVDQLRRDGAHVSLVNTVPVLPGRIYTLYHSLPRDQTRVMMAPQYQQEQVPVNRKVAALCKSWGVPVLEPADGLCEHGCEFRDETGFFYRNLDHLTPHGANALYERMADEFARLIPSAIAAQR